MEELIDQNQWSVLLSSKLPGEEAQFKMAPASRREFKHDGDPLRAAVLFLMYPSTKGTTLVFIKRNEYNGPHSGQVSLPGGAWEAGDEVIENTAIRETMEELGIDGDIKILGSLTELLIPVSNYLVSPFVGCLDHRPEFHPDHSEVQYIIETPLENLLDPRNKDCEMMVSHGQSLWVPFYHINEEKIWGATAMMLCEFLQLASMLR